jgi:hypothetical protein
MGVPHDELAARMERLRGLVRLDRPLLVRVPEHIYYLTGHEPVRDAPAALVIDQTNVHGLWADALPDGHPTRRRRHTGSARASRGSAPGPRPTMRSRAGRPSAS